MKITIIHDGIEKEYTAEKPMTLLHFLQEQGISGIESPCGGRGTCRKCKVKVEMGRQTFAPLACQIRICNGMRVILPESRQALIAKEGNCRHYAPDPELEGYAVACDIGTTTIVCHLIDCRSGKKIASLGEMNAQKIFGADVISRIQSAAEGKLEQEHQAVTGQINHMIARLCSQNDTAPQKKIHYLAAAGNTVMLHLFAGLSPESIGKAPYRPQSYFGEEREAEQIGLDFDGKVYLAPAVAGYVGGDITADLLAVDADSRDENFLLLDIGTNGEMMIGNREGFWCCAAAAGPAFEGGCIGMGMPAAEGAISGVEVIRAGGKKQLYCSTIGRNKEASGICGSGLVDALAVMLENGIIDETGRFPDDCPEPFRAKLHPNQHGEEAFWLTEKVWISQADIQQLQLAKAAIAAGIRILMKESGISRDRISALILAGGFGSYLNPVSAAAIGLFPKECLSKVQSVGNAAGEGALSAAISSKARRKLTEIRNRCRYIELSAHPDFTDVYLDEMFFEAE